MWEKGKDERREEGRNVRREGTDKAGDGQFGKLEKETNI